MGVITREMIELGLLEPNSLVKVNLHFITLEFSATYPNTFNKFINLKSIRLKAVCVPAPEKVS